jgi:nitrite reductase (NADH) small subunit
MEDNHLLEYVFVGKTSDFPPNSLRMVEGLDRVPTCLINRDGEFFAVSGVCPHKGGYLWEGELKGEFVTCPYHKAYFRIRDGRNSWPAPRAVRSFPVKVEGDLLYIGINGKSSKASASC